MRIYISGQVTGTKDYKKRFSKAEKMLNKMGHSVVNPVKVGRALPKLKWHEYMKVDLSALEICEAIYMVEGWENSKGARLEREYAKEKGMSIIYDKKGTYKRS